MEKKTSHCRIATQDILSCCLVQAGAAELENRESRSDEYYKKVSIVSAFAKSVRPISEDVDVELLEELRRMWYLQTTHDLESVSLDGSFSSDNKKVRQLESR